MRYFDGTNWQLTWDSTTVGNALPTAVEITLELPPGGETATKNTEPGYRLCRVVSIPCGRGVSAGTTTTTTGLSSTSGGTP